MYRLIFGIVLYFNCQLSAVKATHLKQMCLPVIGSRWTQRQPLASATTALKAIKLNSFDIKQYRLLS